MYEKYKQEARQFKNIKKNVLELRMSALINNAVRIGSLENITKFQFGAFIMSVDEEKRIVECISWTDSEHKGYEVSKPRVSKLIADYVKLGLNKRGNNFKQDNNTEV